MRICNQAFKLILPIILFAYQLSSYCQQRQYDLVGGRDNSTGLTYVMKGGKHGYIDDTGREIIPLKYDEIGDFGDGERPAAFRVGSKWGFVDKNGKEVVPAIYAEAFGFEWNNTYSPVQEKANGKWYYIDINGKKLNFSTYDMAYPFSEGLAAVSLKANDPCFFINEKGYKAFSLQFEDVKWGFFGDFAWVMHGGKWGMIDKKGKEVVKFQYPYSSSTIDFNYFNGNADVTYQGKKYYYDSKAKLYSSAQERDNANRKQDARLANLEWLTPSLNTSSPNYEVKVKVTSPSKIEHWDVSLRETPSGVFSQNRQGSNQMTITKTLTLNPGLNYVIVSVSNADGTATLEKTVNYTQSSVPTITFITFSVDTVTVPTYNVQATIKSNTKLLDWKVLINSEGGTSRGISVAKEGEKVQSINKNVELKEGVNTIKIFARNDVGSTTSATKTVIYRKQNIQPQRTEKRVALVMANKRYASIEGLGTTVNDARALSEKLRNLKFDVTYIEDKGFYDMRNSISSFLGKANTSDVAVIFYAGHGMQKGYQSYLLPIDLPYPLCDNEFSSHTLLVRDIVNQLSQTKARVKITILDACRDNADLGCREMSTRSINRKSTGFHIEEPPVGMITAYSADEGQKANDDGYPATGHSPYMMALLDALDQPGLAHTEFFNYVERKTMELVNKPSPQYENRSQHPTIIGNISGVFYFNPIK